MKLRNQLLLLLLFALPAASLLAQTSTVYFYRNKSLIMSNSGCMLIVNDSSKVSLANGSYEVLKTSAASIDIVTSVKNIGLKNLSLEKGKTYYIELDPKNPSTVELIQRNEYMGKPAIERIDADKMAESAAELKTVQVTEVASMPAQEEEQSKIYLFRPFNVLGINNQIKVSDGEVVYEMKNNSAHVISTTKGEMNLVTVLDAKGSSNSSLKLKLEKGKVYYVAVLKSGGAIILSESKEEYAKKEMKQ